MHIVPIMKHPHKVETFPLSRVATFDMGVIGRKKHRIVGLLEVDVTHARQRLREMRRAGSAISFTSWFVKTVAATVEEIPQVHGVLRGRRRFVFDDIDVALMVERFVNGTPVPLPTVLEACNSRSLESIESGIMRAANQPVGGAQDFQLGRRRSKIVTALFYRLPQFLRLAVFGAMLKNPKIRKQSMGTVIVTSVAAGIRFPGWIIPRTMHNLAFGLGSVIRKPRVVGEEVLPRDVLHLTVILDHDVVDGAPAARFTSRLVKNLETAAVLCQE